MKLFNKLLSFFKSKPKEDVKRCEGCGLNMNYDTRQPRCVGGHEVSKHTHCYNCYRFILLNNKINYYLLTKPHNNIGPEDGL